MIGDEATPTVTPRRKLFRRVLWIAFAATLIALVAAVYVFRPLPVPVSPTIESLKPSLETGAYLAKIGNCTACHNAPGGAAFAGGVKFKTDFGTLYSTNITPDPIHGIGRWRFNDFYTAMKQGVRPDGAHLYPAFPYSHFAGMGDNDIASLYRYLRSLPPVKQANHRNAMRFPFGERQLLHFWKRLYHSSEELRVEPSQSRQWNRGQYLVSAVAHCGACHTPRGMVGGPDLTRNLNGGSYFDQTSRGTYRIWAAVDLTPGKRGLARWSRDDIISYLLTGKNRHAVVHGPMVEVFESTRYLTPDDANAIAIYLKGITPAPRKSSMGVFGGGDDAGAIVYAVHCGTCHLPDGRGDPILGVSLRRNPIVQAADPSSLINVVLYGPHLPSPPFSTGRSNMKPFGKRLSDDDIAALASFLRGNFGNDSGRVTAKQVKAQR